MAQTHPLPRLFNYLGALLAAIALWRGMAMLMNISLPFGRVSSGETLIVFAPAILFVFPYTLVRIEQLSPGKALWMFAATPLLAILNIVVVLLTILAFRPLDNENAALMILCVAWAIPTAILFSKRKFRAPAPDQMPACDGHRMLDAAAIVVGFSVLLALTIKPSRVLLSTIFSANTHGWPNELLDKLYQALPVGQEFIFQAVDLLVAWAVCRLFVRRACLLERLPKNIPGTNALATGIALYVVSLCFIDPLHFAQGPMTGYTRLFFTFTAHIFLITGATRVLLATLPRLSKSDQRPPSTP